MSSEHDETDREKIKMLTEESVSDATDTRSSNALKNQTEPLENWAALSHRERIERFASLDRTDAVDLFLSLGAYDQAEILNEIPPKDRRPWVRLLAPDDAADLIQVVDEQEKADLIELLDHQSRREVTALLAYAEDKAGGLMSSRFIRLRPDMNVDEAISYIRIQSKTQVETIYYAYVVDTDQTLMGVVSFRELFAASPMRKIRDIMKTEVQTVPVGLDQEKVAKIFSQKEFLALPVVDEWNHIKGIVTFDDIAGVLEEEATEDIHKLAAIETLNAPYMKTGFFELVRKRAGWLMVLFVGQMLTMSAMAAFQIELEKAVVLALFIPLIISAGGNSGSQASTLIIRALALGEIRLKDWWRVLLREIIVGASLGLLLGLVGLARIVFWPEAATTYGAHFQLLAQTVGVSVFCCVIWGTISGSMLPFVLSRLRLDPATASAPFIATMVDVTGLVIYFTLAAVMLSGSIL